MSIFGVGFLPQGSKPSVQHINGKIAVWASVEGGAAGIGFDPMAATETALAILRAAGEAGGDHTPFFPFDAVAGRKHPMPDGEMGAVLTVKVSGLPIAFLLDPTQLAELAADLAAASKAVDRP